VDKITFPYGNADFYSIMTEENFYVDRTNYIPLLEDKGRTLLFLRPRRFGKSLLLSMLENYYDVNKAVEFDRLFGQLAIGQNPTPRHNQYLILRWNFSMVATQGTSEQLQQSLYTHINRSIYAFTRYYAQILKPEEIEIDRTDALGTFQTLLAAVQTTPYKLSLLIDEYDNVANEVLTAERDGRHERYRELVEGEGIFKAIFKTVKAALEGRGLDRVFITGVSPVLVHDMTSGFNVARNISLDPDLHELCGFSSAQVQEALDMLRTFYNGYRFGYGQPTLVYNPTLVLYFLQHLQQTCHYPRQMLDSNMGMDRQKIAYIAHLPNGEEVIATALNEQEPLAIPDLSERFGVHEMFYGDRDDPFLVSLLYYFGVLTPNGYTRQGKLMLAIPNLVVRKLYVEQMRAVLLPKGTSNQALHIAEDFHSTGDMGAVCTFIEQTYFTVYDNRDYRWTNELTIKTIFLTLLYNDIFYIMDSEPALQREYADLVMIVRPDQRQYDLLDFLIEFKYVSLADVGLSGEAVRGMEREELAALPAVVKKQADAQTKLTGYRKTLQSLHSGRLRLRCFNVVAIGYERLVWVAVV